MSKPVDMLYQETGDRNQAEAADSRFRAEIEQNLLHNLTANCSAKIKQDLSLSYTTPP